MFTSGEVQHLTGIPQQHLTYWDQSGLVRPSGRSAQGRGSRRLYTALDLLQIRLIHRLRSAGLSLQKVRKALRVLLSLVDEPVPLAELEVLSDGKRIIVRRSNDDLVDPLVSQYVLRLPISALLADLPPSRILPTATLSPHSVGSISYGTQEALAVKEPVNL
jgi:DNA-binding transcriptional MerR regulator